MQGVLRRLRKYTAVVLCISILSCTFANDVMASNEFIATDSNASDFKSKVFEPEIYSRYYFENGKLVENTAYTETQTMSLGVAVSGLLAWIFLVACAALGLFSVDRAKIDSLVNGFMETVVPGLSIVDPSGVLGEGSVREKFNTALSMSVTAGLFSMYKFRELTGIDLISVIKSYIRTHWDSTEVTNPYVIPMSSTYVFNKIPDSLVSEFENWVTDSSDRMTYYNQVKEYIDGGCPFALTVLRENGDPVSFSLIVFPTILEKYTNYMWLNSYGDKTSYMEWKFAFNHPGSTSIRKAVLSYNYRKSVYEYEVGSESSASIELYNKNSYSAQFYASGAYVLTLHDYKALGYSMDVYSNFYNPVKSVPYDSSKLGNISLHLYSNPDMAFNPNYEAEIPPSFAVGDSAAAFEEILSAITALEQGATGDKIKKAVESAFQSYMDGLSGTISDSNTNLKGMAATLAAMLAFFKDSTATGFLQMLVSALAAAFQVSTIVASLTDIATRVAGWNIDNWDQVLKGMLSNLNIAGIDTLINLLDVISVSIDSWEIALGSVLERVNIKGLDQINTALAALGDWTFADWKDVFDLAITVPILAALNALPDSVSNAVMGGLGALGLNSEALSKALANALAGFGLELDLDALKGVLSGLGLGVLSGLLSQILEIVKAGGLSTVLETILTAIKALPASIAASLPGGSGGDKEDSGNSGLINLFQLIVLLGMILVMLLILFINCLRLIVVIFNIPACTEFLNADIIKGIDFLKSVMIPKLGLSVYDLLFGVVYLVLFFSIIKVIRRRIDHIKIK